MKKLVLTGLVLLSVKSFAQTTDARSFPSRNSFWTETIFNGKIKNKWSWQLDYQYRRQSDASFNSAQADYSSNMFKTAYQQVYRPWIHYQLNENVRLSLSPIGFWETYASSVDAGTANTTKSLSVVPELRICPQVTLTNKIGERLTIDQRYRFEFRAVGNTKYTSTSSINDYTLGTGDFPMGNRKMRMRYFLRATLPLNNKKITDNTFYLVAWNELFLGIGQNTPNDKLLDQNRSFLLLGYKPKMDFPMRFEIGPGYILQNTFSSKMVNGVFNETGNRMVQNRILQVYVIFENFNKLFTYFKKDKPVEALK